MLWVIALNAIACDPLVDNETSETTAALTSPFAAQMAALGPNGWWRLGDPSSTTVAADSSGSGHPGSYTNFTTTQHAVAGAIAGDSDGAIAVSGVGTTGTCSSGNAGNFVQVPDNDLWSLAKAYDHFNRTGQVNGWGNAAPGYSWTPEVTTATTAYSTDGTHAIIDEPTAATWEMGLPLVQRIDTDSQISANWTPAARDAQIIPVSLVARRTSESNYYRAELRNNTDGTLDLRITKFLDGTSTNIGTGPKSVAGPYVAGQNYYVRFQVEGQNLRAKAWKAGDVEPDWMVTGTDSSPLPAGEVAVRSSNAGSDARKLTFDDFREQSIGLTLHLFMSPSTLAFSNSDGYTHFGGKGESSTEDEWGFRFYPSVVGGGSGSGAPNRMSGYIWNTDGGLGAGAHWDPNGSITAGAWYQVVVVYDPGDSLDPNAGVSFYVNGACTQGTRPGCPTPTPDAVKYKTYGIVPGQGIAPIRIGTRDCHQFFSGRLDEMAVFNRELTGTEITNLYTAATQP